MDGVNLTELVSGYRDRLRRLILIDPLLELERKKEADEQGKKIDMLGLGILSLLFFFERRLSREYKTGRKKLAQFLRKITKNVYILSDKQLEDLAHTIITTFRPATGKKRHLPFYNWENHQEEEIQYSILKDNDFDLKTNEQFYTLDDDGLELVFSTKEFYSEYQISINQLLLRQQLMKGEFHGALRQIREMEISVYTLKERIEKLKLEILRSIVSEETFERYRMLLGDTYLRLEREDEEFKALKTFVIETTDTLHLGDTRKKEQKSYELLLKITKELEAVHYEHGRLLTLTSELKNTALETARESLYYTGIASFNFDKDIVSEILAKPLPPDAMKGILHPFLQVEENPQWSPMTLFAEQSITEEQEERDDYVFMEVEESQAEDEYRLLLAEKYGELMEAFLAFLGEKKTTTLKKWMEFLSINNGSILEKRYFYSFWMLLHQRSPLINDQYTEEEEEKNILGEALALLKNKRFIVSELPDVIQLNKRYTIQNMKITLEED